MPNWLIKATDLLDKGFRITMEENTNGAEEDLDRIRPSAEFSHYRREDLLTLHSYLVACKLAQ